MSSSAARVSVGIVLLLSLGLSPLAAIAAPGAVPGSAPNTLTSKELAEGWVLLFDGETLFGWQPASKANWKAADGVISADAGEPGLLCTTSQFGNYVLKVDFRTTPQTNSGVFLRTAPTPKPEDVRDKCYELNIADPAVHPFPTGSFAGRKRCEGDHASTEWQTFEVTADGGHFLVKLDGKTVLDYTDPKPVLRGHVGLQFNKGKIEFRNIKLKPLGMVSLFNGRDLSGLEDPSGEQEPLDRDARRMAPPGKRPRANWRPKGQYADFTLQLEVFVNGKWLNSGVFFRSIPGAVPERLREPDPQRLQGQRPDQAGRLRHRRHLPPPERPQGGGQRPRVVRQDDPCRRACTWRFGSTAIR